MKKNKIVITDCKDCGLSEELNISITKKHDKVLMCRCKVKIIPFNNVIAFKHDKVVSDIPDWCPLLKKGKGKNV